MKLSLPEPENVTLFLLLLYLDPSTSAELRRDVSLTLEDVLVSISSGADDEKTKVSTIMMLLLRNQTGYLGTGRVQACGCHDYKISACGEERTA
jgi:hypothetical protein